MLQRYSHFLFVAIALVVAAVISFNLPSSAEDESQEYFFQPVPRTNLVVIEPNYGHMFHEGQTTKEASRHLYNSLGKLQQTYDICKTELIQFERKGKMIPNLYVYVEASDAKQVFANNAVENSESESKL